MTTIHLQLQNPDFETVPLTLTPYKVEHHSYVHLPSGIFLSVSVKFIFGSFLIGLFASHVAEFFVMFLNSLLPMPQVTIVVVVVVFFLLWISFT